MPIASLAARVPGRVPGVAAALALAAFAVVATGCNTPRASSATDIAALDSAGADAGELTCEDLGRARGLCLDAMATRCHSQESDCERACESQAGLPGNTQKLPSSRNEAEATQCRESCRGTRDACLRSVAGRCPAPCT